MQSRRFVKFHDLISFDVNCFVLYFDFDTCLRLRILMENQAKLNSCRVGVRESLLRMLTLPHVRRTDGHHAALS